MSQRLVLTILHCSVQCVNYSALCTVDYASKGKGSFGGEFGASHCNQWGMLRSFAVVHEPIELPLGEVSWVG